jgi:fatty acid desaturase
LPHPPRHSPPPRLPVEETVDLRPPVREEEPAPPVQARRAEPPQPILEPGRPTPRSRADRAVLAVLWLGLVLTALVLLRNAALARADVLLGATVLLAGFALLGLMEYYRRTGR